MFFFVLFGVSTVSAALSTDFFGLAVGLRRRRFAQSAQASLAQGEEPAVFGMVFGGFWEVFGGFLDIVGRFLVGF